MKSAFRNLGLSPKVFHLLLMVAKSPIDGKTYFFIEKCLPFGSSISCSHFQRFSNSIAHIVKVRTRKIPENYLDDYLFISWLKSHCDSQVKVFLDLCAEICFPVAMEKTYWGSTLMTFLGFLIDTVGKCISVPVDKVGRALQLLQEILDGKKSKTTIKQLQKLCGFLNFLCHCVVPGQAFTRRLYTKFSPKMKPNYHLRVTRDMKQDLRLWKEFLLQPLVYARPFLDFSQILSAVDLDLFTDASGKIACGGIFEQKWFYMQWGEGVSVAQPKYRISRTLCSNSSCVVVE